MEQKKIKLVLIATGIIVALLMGYEHIQSESTKGGEESLKAALDARYEAQQGDCYLRLADGTCLAREEIGIIERTSINTLCVQSKIDCTNSTEYKRAVVSLIIYNNLSDKKLILLN